MRKATKATLIRLAWLLLYAVVCIGVGILLGIELAERGGW